jgi:hypothetical protein
MFPARYVWEGKVLYQAVSTEEKIIFLHRYIERVEALGAIKAEESVFTEVH